MPIADGPVRGPTSSAQVLAVDAAGSHRRPDRLVTEEPMEIRAHGPGEEPQPVAVTMRTPGNDFELAAGFLITEGLIGPSDIAGIAYCVGGEGEQLYNVVTVRTRRPVAHRIHPRHFAAHGGCGLCGKTALEHVEASCRPVDSELRVDARVLASLPSRLSEAQAVFEQTGGLHAAACFSADGSTFEVREDIGRHNALDKLIGALLLAGEPEPSQSVLLLSGRAGFELVQKAAVAGFPVVAAVSAPSSLAVATALRLNMSLVGFVREGRMNVYCGAERIEVER